MQDEINEKTDNESGYSMNYEYDANTGKVKKFYEVAGGTTGAIVEAEGAFTGIQTYRYCGPDRVLGNSDDIVSHSVMDYFGRTTSSYSTNYDGTLVYGASATAYNANTGTSATIGTMVIRTGSTRLAASRKTRMQPQVCSSNRSIISDMGNFCPLSQQFGLLRRVQQPVLQPDCFQAL